MSTTREQLPAFFDAAPTITLRDPLACFLGACEDGVFTYRYADVVRLAGHSCPTVAGTFLMVRAGLKALYEDAIPVRGEIGIAFPDAPSEGVTGVMAGVATLLTGATMDSGFHGLAGRFDRRQLMAFDAPVQGDLRIYRLENNQSVTVSLSTASIPAHPDMRSMMSLCIQGLASPEESRYFGELWQDRVRRLLCEYADDPDVIRLH